MCVVLTQRIPEHLCFGGLSALERRAGDPSEPSSPEERAKVRMECLNYRLFFWGFLLIADSRKYVLGFLDPLLSLEIDRVIDKIYR